MGQGGLEPEPSAKLLVSSVRGENNMKCQQTTHPPCQQQASAVRCSIVSEANFNPISWQLMGIRCTQDLVSFNLGIDNL